MCACMCACMCVCLSDRDLMNECVIRHSVETARSVFLYVCLRTKEIETERAY